MLNASIARTSILAALIVALGASKVQTAELTHSEVPTAETRKALVEAIGRSLIEGYIYEDVAKKMATHLTEQLKTGRYDEIKSGSEFAKRLTEDLSSITKDRHLTIFFNEPRPEAQAERFRIRTAGSPTGDSSHGFVKVEILDDNTGFLDLRGFVGVPAGFARASAVMTLLADVRALIIDLGHNRGGDAEMVKHLSTYFFEKPTHLVDTFMRGMEKPSERWTLKDVPGQRLPQIPVYLLTSRKSISAAESFAFGLRINNRVTIVGEPTGGGGHFGEVRPLVGNFSIWLPRGRTYDPNTGKGWEATGIKPDIEVPYEKALATALDHARGGKK